MNLFIKWIISCCVFNIVKINAEKKSYRGYQVWQVDLNGKNMSDEFIRKMDSQAETKEKRSGTIEPTCFCKDVWMKHESSIDFLLSANETASWAEFLGKHRMNYRTLLRDVQENIEMESLMRNELRRSEKMSWTSYPKLKEIYTFLDNIAASNRNCTLSVIGKTAHKRDIKLLKLSNGNKTNQAILIESGMHAREWTAVVSVLYFIEGIARNFSAQPAYVTDTDWYIIPMLNPDGYDYSMTKDRMWRKNRRLFSGPCDGVDINRNFDVSWCERGGSSIICSQNYCGVHPFSEAESIALMNTVSGRHFLAYISVHSYGRRVLFPWASKVTPSRDIKQHLRVSKSVADAMYAVDKHTFKTGSVARAGQESGSGMAVDWAYTQGVTHSYLLETRGQDIGGYFLEPEQIFIAAREIYAGLMQFARIM